jgi:hypothetical protein
VEHLNAIRAALRGTAPVVAIPMALHALSLERVKAMNKEQRTEYFEKFAGYFWDSPNAPYSIRVGSKTFHSKDTLDLREQFDKYLS